MSKLLFWLVGTVAYPLLVYVILPYFVARMDVGSTDAAGAGMAKAFSYIYGCIIWSVVLFFAQMLVEWLLFHAVWRTLGCALAGLALVWALQAGEQYWQDNRKSDFTEYYDTGEVERRGQHIGTSGLLHGQITTYYKNGKIKSIETYQRDRVAGDCKLFYESGVLKAEGRLFVVAWEEFHDGVWRYYDESGALDDQREFRMGDLLSSQHYTLFADSLGIVRTIADKTPYTGKLDKQGIVRSGALFPNLFTCELVDGAIEQGAVTEYYKFGSKTVLAGTYTYVDKQLNGERHTYHTNGQLSAVCTYSNGKIEGEYTTYYADSVAARPHGEVEYRCNYLNHQRNGVARWYTPEGELDSEQPHRQGVRDGVTVRYYRQPGRVQLLQTLYINDETLSNLISANDQAWDRSQIQFDRTGSDPEFLAEFDAWRRVDPSWLLMERVIQPDTIVSRLNVGQQGEACYRLLRLRVIPGGGTLPEVLPDDGQSVSVTLPTGYGALRAEVSHESYHQWRISVINADRRTTYDLSDACNGSWLEVTQSRLPK